MICTTATVKKHTKLATIIDKYTTSTDYLLWDLLRYSGMRKPYDNADRAQAATNDHNNDGIVNNKIEVRIERESNIIVPIKKFKSNKYHRIIEVDHSKNSFAKCAKMTEEHGMIRNGSLNGVGIANILLRATAASVSSTPSTAGGNASSSPVMQQISPNSRIATVTSILPSRVAFSPSRANGDSNQASLDGGGDDMLTKSPVINNGYHNNDARPSNGDAASPPASSAPHKLPIVNSNGQTTGVGGRLQFFKDGKFILELARSREGDRTGWVSVPRKTYWPPTAPSVNNINHHKNESSTSLSFSDDNSSIQSSPWQRDHCWKQANPRRSISKEMCLYFYRPSAIVLSQKSRTVAKRKSRRPYDNKNAVNEIIDYVKRTNGTNLNSDNNTKCMKTIKNELNEQKSNEQDNNETNNKNDEDSKESSQVDSKVNVKEEIKIENDGDTVDSINNSNCEKTEENENCVDSEPMIVDECTLPSHKCQEQPIKDKILLRSKTVALLKRTDLSSILQKLINRVQDQPHSAVSTKQGPGAGLFATGNYISPNSSTLSRNNDLYYHQQHVSPRKRILREFEKVSLEDATPNSTKRSRSKSGNTLNGIGQHSTTTTAPPSTTTTTASHQLQKNIATCGTTQNIPTNTSLSNNRMSPVRTPFLLSACGPTTPRMRTVSMSNGNHTITGSNEAVSKSAPTPTGQTQQSQSQLPSAGHFSPVQANQQQSRPFSSYSITSLLGHSVNNNSSTDSSGNLTGERHKSDGSLTRDGAINEYTTRRASPRSPTPVSPAHQSSSSRLNSSNAKKKSPTNGNTITSSATSSLSNSPYHQQHHRSPMNSPVNYGRTSTRSPNLSPSGFPFLGLGSPVLGTGKLGPKVSDTESEAIFRHQRQYSNPLSSISSPTSSFHPYMPPTTRASPSTSGALSPPMTNDMQRYRSSYKTTGSPSSGAHSYSSTSGSPSSYSARYSPSYSQLSPPPSSSTSTNPTTVQHTKPTGSPYNVSFLQSSSSGHSNSNARSRDVPSPPRSTSASSTKAIPKKTASIQDDAKFGGRQKLRTPNLAPYCPQYGSPNSDKYSYPPSRSSSANDNSPPSTRSEPSPHSLRKSLMDTIDPLPKGASRSASPTDMRRSYDNLLDRPPPPLIPSIHSDGMPPPSPHHPAYYAGLYPPHSVGAAAAAAAYLSPAYANQLYSEVYQRQKNFAAAYPHPLPYPYPYPRPYPEQFISNLSLMCPPIKNIGRHVPACEYVDVGDDAAEPHDDRSPALGYPKSAAAQPAQDRSGVLFGQFAESALSLGHLPNQRSLCAGDQPHRGAEAHPWGPPQSPPGRHDAQPIPLFKDDSNSDVPLNLSKH